jgi:hypothetical protein
MNTAEIMALALELAGLDAVPGDSAIHHAGDGIERVLLGIDLQAAELQIAKTLGYDAAIAHHPAGGSSALRFHEVLRRHVEQMVGAGVPRDAAEDTMRETIEQRRVLSSMANYDHQPSVARLLDLPFLNIHTPLDEIGRRRMAEVVSGLDEDATVGWLIERLRETFVEFQDAATSIELRLGKSGNRVGRAVVSHAAGTNGGYPVAKAYFDHGVDTLLYIHCRPGDSDRLAAEYGATSNLVVTGHIASDSVGITPFVYALRERGLTVDPISGVLGVRP